MDVLGRDIGFIALGIAALAVVVGLLQERGLLEMFLVGVSLAVAVIPEGLPAVVTLTLAIGIKTMMQKNCLIRRLPASETLGAVSVICTDKTGTLTRNEMAVVRVKTPGAEVTVTGTGYAPEGEFLLDGGQSRGASADGPSSSATTRPSPTTATAGGGSSGPRPRGRSLSRRRRRGSPGKMPRRRSMSSRLTPPGSG